VQKALKYTKIFYKKILMNVATSGRCWCEKPSDSQGSPQKCFPAQGGVLKFDFERREIIPSLFLKNQGAWPAQSEHMALDLGVVSSSPMLGVEIT